MNSSIVSLSPESISFNDCRAGARLGVIALATDLTSEGDFYRQVPVDQASIFVTRVAFENPTTPENLRKMKPRIKAAAELLLPVGPLDAVCYSCTAASVVIGDEEVTDVINEVLENVPVVTPSGAALLAFEALGISRISVLTPYRVETSKPMVQYFTERGLRIQAFHCLGIDDDREMARVSIESIVATALATDTPTTEGFFLSCTALPAIGAIEEIEKRTGKPVVTSNQATAWALMRHSGIKNGQQEFGVLFGQDFR